MAGGYLVTRCFSQDEWESMTDEDQRAAFRLHNVLVKANRNLEEEEEDDTLKVDRLRKYVDVHTKLQARGEYKILHNIQIWLIIYIYIFRLYDDTS